MTAQPPLEGSTGAAGPAPGRATAESALVVDDLCVAYGGVRVVHEVCFDLEENDVLIVLGRNGAGKTSTARALAGFVKPDGGRIVFEGEQLGQMSSWDIARRGVAFVPEAAGIFPSLSVVDNLRMWFRRQGGRAAAGRLIDSAFDVFPALASHRKQAAGTLSGGEQRMLALSRVLVLEPRLVILDEPSLGLAPALIDQVYASLERLRQLVRSLIVIEQFADRALEFGTRAVVLNRGVNVWNGPTADLSVEALEEIYLGND